MNLERTAGNMEGYENRQDRENISEMKCFYGEMPDSLELKETEEPQELPPLSDGIDENEQAAYAESLRTFVTNSGAEISYKCAFDQVGESINDLFEQAGQEGFGEVSQETRTEILKDVRVTLEQMQKCTDERKLGEHGIRHIYANVERTRQLLKDQTPDVQMAGLIAQIYHDTGYMDEKIHKEHGSDKPHDIYGAQFFKERQDLYDKVPFLGRHMDSIEKAIKYHNREIDESGHMKRPQNDMEAELVLTDLEQDPVIAATVIADKMALGEREKMAELYQTDGMIELIQGMYSARDLFKNLSAESQREILKEFKSTFEEQIERQYAGVSEELKQKFLHVFDADILEGEKIDDILKTNEELLDRILGMSKYVVGMTVIDTGTPCIMEHTPDGEKRALLTINLLEREKAKKLLGDELADRQLIKFFEDFGIHDKTEIKEKILPQLYREGTYSFEKQKIDLRVRDVKLDDEDERKVHRDRLELRKKSYSEIELLSKYDADCEKKLEKAELTENDLISVKILLQDSGSDVKQELHRIDETGKKISDPGERLRFKYEEMRKLYPDKIKKTVFEPQKEAG